MGTPAAAARLAAAILAARGERCTEDEPFPTLDDHALGDARTRLSAGAAPVLAREEAMSLLRHGPRLGEMEVRDFPPDEVLDLGTALDTRALERLLVEGWGGSAAPERGALWRMACEEAGAWGPSVDPWIPEEEDLSGEPSGPRWASELRWMRLEGVLADRWAAWTRLGGLRRSRPGGRLVWTLGLPGGERPGPRTFGFELDLVLSMDDIKDARGAQARRRQAVERIASALRDGARVAWVANNTTLASRRAVLSVARAAHAEVEALFFDDPHEAVAARLEALEWPLDERTLRRGLEVLEGPRLHEAERVTVVRAGQVVESWVATRQGFRSTAA